MFELPTYITIQEKDYKIRNDGDYRMVLDCFKVYEDSQLDDQSKVLTSLAIFYDDIKSLDDLDIFEDYTQEAIDKMFEFFDCGQKNSVGSNVNYKVMSWEQDQHLIASAVNNVANMEIRALPYLHWWTFMGYYLAIGDSAFSTVVSIRHKIKKGKKLEDYEKQFKKDNPQYFVWNSDTQENKDADDYIRKLWNNNGG